MNEDRREWGDFVWLRRGNQDVRANGGPGRQDRAGEGMKPSTIGAVTPEELDRALERIWRQQVADAYQRGYDVATARAVSRFSLGLPIEPVPAETARSEHVNQFVTCRSGHTHI